MKNENWVICVILLAFLGLAEANNDFKEMGSLNPYSIEYENLKAEGNFTAQQVLGKVR